MNIGVELLGSYLKGFTFVIPDFIWDPDTLFSLITRSESFLLDSVSILFTARNEKREKSKEAYLLILLVYFFGKGT